ncbi:hypothetical protein RFI_24737, partial [Reticulomyxa filosa]
NSNKNDDKNKKKSNDKDESEEERDNETISGVDKFNFVLQSQEDFEVFMSHLQREFSMENALALIEMCQMEDLIIKEMMDASDERIQFSKKYNFQFYKDIPKSSLVWDETCDIWDKMDALYRKYVMIGSSFELNLSHKTRTQWQEFVHDIEARNPGINLKRALDLIERVLTGIRGLLFDSFSRFDGTVAFNVDNYTGLQRQMSTSQADEHEVKQHQLRQRQLQLQLQLQSQTQVLPHVPSPHSRHHKHNKSSEKELTKKLKRLEREQKELERNKDLKQQSKFNKSPSLGTD